VVLEATSAHLSRFPPPIGKVLPQHLDRHRPERPILLAQLQCRAAPSTQRFANMRWNILRLLNRNGESRRSGGRKRRWFQARVNSQLHQAFCTCARTVSGGIASSAAISLTLRPRARSLSTRFSSSVSSSVSGVSSAHLPCLEGSMHSNRPARKRLARRAARCPCPTPALDGEGRRTRPRGGRAGRRWRRRWIERLGEGAGRRVRQ